jgi:ribosomal protein S18 acetylase RimI-like enzyme
MSRIKRKADMDFSIRRAAQGDEGMLAAMNAIVQELHVRSHPEYFKQTNTDEVAEWFKSRLDQPTTQIWIAQAGGSAIGYVVATRQESPEHVLCRDRQWFQIDEIAVAPQWQQKGVGRSLVQEVIAEARRHGIDEVELSSWSFNQPAHAAFLQMGFQPKTVRFWMKVGAK